MKTRNIIAFGLLDLVGGGAAVVLSQSSQTNQSNQASAAASASTPAPSPSPPAPSPSAPVNDNTTIDPLTGSAATYGYLVGLAVAVDMEVLALPNGGGVTSGVFLIDAAKMLSPIDSNGNPIPAPEFCPAD